MNDDSLGLKIGQMLIVGFRGEKLDSNAVIFRDVKEGRVGGVILFDYDVPTKTPQRNIRSIEQVRALCASMQRVARIPLFIAIDQEGGKIVRLKEKNGFPPTISAQRLGAIDDLDSTRIEALRMASMLRLVGINMNMAPVLDLNINPKNPVIGGLERSYSANPNTVTRHARCVLDAFRVRSVVGVVKHFPGHGSSREDSHLGMTDITDTYQQAELEPYRTLIVEGKVDAVMTGHLFHRTWDSARPATLSRKIITGLLRDSLHFDGIIISDDLQMKAISEHFGLETAVIECINAGVDILLFANNSIFDEAIASKVIALVDRAIAEGKISRQRIDESFQRIMNLKRKFASSQLPAHTD